MSYEEQPDTILSEVLSASIGGAVSTSLLYPLEVLKTRMQSSEKSCTTSTRSEPSLDNDDEAQNDKDDEKKKEGEEDETESSNGGMIEYARRLYKEEGYTVYLKGIELSAFQSSVEKALYFFAYTALKRIHGTIQHLLRGRNHPHSISTGTNILLGCLAEWAHLPITLPIDCLTTAIQTTKRQNAMQLFLTILREGNMYKGIQAYYVLCFKPALQYTVFEQIKATILKSRRKKSLTVTESFLLGMVARTVATVAVFPFIRAKVVLQSRRIESNPMISSEKKTSIRTLLVEIFQSNGITGLYQGLGPELTRGIFSAALMLMIKEQLNGSIKTLLYRPMKK